MSKKKKKVILIVDDDITVLRFVESNLRRWGFEVRTADDGEPGLEWIKKNHADMIFLDFVMPKMNGYVFATKLQELKGTNVPPVVLMSSTEERVAARMQETTCIVDYIQKPVKAHLLKEAVTKHLAEKSDEE